jgi:acetyltransferase-like isoleucine patch superfamily enzyme
MDYMHNLSQIAVIYVCYNYAVMESGQQSLISASPLDGLRWVLERGLRRLRIGIFSFIYRNWLRLRGMRVGRGVKFEGRMLVKGAHRVRIGAHSTVGRFIQLDTLHNGYIILGEHCFLGHFSIITANLEVKIGDKVLISPNCFITDVNHGIKLGMPMIEQIGTNLPVRIGNDVWLGTMTVIAPGAIIGDGAVLGAASFVNGEIQPLAVAVGQPAKVVKIRDETDPQSKYVD